MRRIWVIIGMVAVLGVFMGCGCAVEKHTYHGSAYYNPNWFPDGKVVYLENYDRYRIERYFPAGDDEITLEDSWYVCEMNSDGSGQKRIVEMRLDGSGNPTHRTTHNCVSATNDRIVYGIQGEIWVLNRDGSGLRKITNGEYPDFNPDGTKIVYEKHYITMPGSDTLIINGETISYDEHREGIWIYDLTTGKDSCIISDTLAMMPAWSPDGGKIAYVRGEREVWILDLVEGIQKLIAEFSPGNLSSPDWSFSSQEVMVFYGYHAQIIDIQSNSFYTGPGIGGMPKWSPNGQWILYGTSDIFRVNIDGSEYVKIAQSYTEEE